MNFQVFPKINLHHHLEGAVRVSTYLELAIKYGILPASTTLDEAKELLQTTTPMKDLVEYLVKVDRTVEITKTKEDIKRLVEENIIDAANNGVIYLELRGGPTIHVKENLSLEEVCEGIAEGLKSGQEKTGILANFITCALRHESHEVNMELLNTVTKYQQYGFVGFDLAGDEKQYPAKNFVPLFDKAKEAGFGITIHAGEADTYESIVDAITYLHPTRIGHGITSIYSPSTIELIKSKGILLEVSPTSNYHTGAVPSIEEHPIKKLFDLGVHISIGDDDPTTSSIVITDEYEKLHQLLHFTFQDFITIQRNSIAKAFTTETNKIQLLTQIQNFELSQKNS